MEGKEDRDMNDFELKVINLLKSIQKELQDIRSILEPDSVNVRLTLDGKELTRSTSVRKVAIK